MSLVAPEYHVLSEAAKDAKVNGGLVAVNYAILGELLAVWRSVQPAEPEPAPPIADQIAVGNAPAPPINAGGIPIPPQVAADAGPLATTEPPTQTPEPEPETPPATPEPTIQ